MLGVLIFHAFPAALPGGFAGVDIFFVISGYLISGIILQGLERGEFSFADFYARRIRRIFPALALVLSTCLLIGWFVFLPDEYAMLGKHALGGVAFVANFIFRSEDSYFDLSSESKPFLHLWSLGIEEQFYIIWPILLALAYRFRFRLGTPILAVLVLSFGLNIANAVSNPATTFFLPHTRFWELLIGCVLAYAHMRFGRTGTHRWLKLSGVGAGSVAFAGAALIALAYGLLDRTAVFPGWWALAPTLGAALIIHAGTSASFNRYVLASRPLVFIGLISYPLYLWHWPLLSFAHILQIDELAVVRVSLLGLSFVLAWATYRWIETPIRKKRLDVRINTTRTLAGILAAMAMVSLFVYRQALEPRLQEELWPIAEARGDWEYSSKKAIRDSELGLPLRVLTGSTQDAVLFIGDSHIQQFYPRLESLLSDP
ncbi:MAG TPA: acyltransferase, partial [Bryobacteraceae bacterium]|nr:acyltransferase [Bryobacteraceae bacterium]